MEIKALHCSDIHLDASFSGIWGKGHIKREEQRDVFHAICQTAKTEKVDIVLIAGDLFELARINLDTIKFIKEQFNLLSPIPVYISPGNEDPYSPESPYSQTEWPPNVHIFNSNRFKVEEISEKKTFIYGAANRTADDTYETLKSFRYKKKEGIHIAMLHGAERGSIPTGKRVVLPFTIEDLKKSTVHYLALGHFHDKRGLPVEQPFAWYSGAPLHLDFNEQEEKGFILARISPSGNEITFVPTGKRKLFSESVICDEFKDTPQLIEYMKKRSEALHLHTCVTRIILRGYRSARLQINTEALACSLKDYFFQLVIKDETLPFFDIDRLKEERSTRGTFVRNMINQTFRLDTGESKKEHITHMALYRGLESYTPGKVIF